MYVSGYTGDFVLIETYWNVNYFRSTLELNSVQGINRNILECKYDGVGISFSNLYVLIETYWNVNSIVTLILAVFSCRINRNILECKSSLSPG